MIEGALIIVYTFAIAGLAFMASLLHEIGHWLYFKIALGKTVKLTMSQTGEEKDYVRLSKNEKIQIYFSGVFIGLVFIVVFSSLDIFLALALIPYLGGCRSDIRRILALV